MAIRTSSIDIRDLQDIQTPIGERLAGIYKRSFAYVTIKDRLPVILTKIIDTLSRDKEEIVQQFGPDAREEIKQITGAISKLKNEIVTNKQILPLRLLPNPTAKDDTLVWNQYLEERTRIEGDVPTWFNTIWLYCECYMYRRLAQELLLTKSLQTYDPFEKQKKEGFINSLSSISILSKYTLDLMDKHKNGNESAVSEQKQDFMKLLKMNLWGNRCDLSLSAGSDSSQSGDPVELLNSFENDILANDAESIWRLLLSVKSKPPSGSNVLDIVLDNSGYEIFTDLCLSAFITACGFSQKVRFYGKEYPWYVSDVNESDFHWTLDYMKNSSDENIKKLGEVCANFVKNKIWTLEKETYWTKPYEFAEMEKQDNRLYNKLSEAFLVIFKGDLNYRKLLGDINFKYSTNFEEALRGFLPTNLVSLRTVKSDVCVGIPAHKGEELYKVDKNWMISGQYGLIQAYVKCNC